MLLNFVLKGIFVSVVFLALQGCQRVKEPNPEYIELAQFVEAEDLRNAAYVIVVQKDGSRKAVALEGKKLESCRKDRPTKKKPECKLFSEKRQILDVRDTVIVVSQGSPICITEKIGKNTYIETCF